MRRALTLGGITAMLGATATVALAGGGYHRATYEIDTSGKLDRSTASRQVLTYRNPDDPGGKPQAIDRIVITYPRGAKFDTSVPERCETSDSELMARGRDACPPASRVGDGRLLGITGFGAPFDPVTLDLTLFNAADGIIILGTYEGTNQAVAFSRAKLEGRRLKASYPPLPGGPPDGQSVPALVELNTSKISAGRRAYIKTPRRCPASGRWTARVRFFYTDGFRERRKDTVRCTG